MIDYLYIGPSPYDENCAQVGEFAFVKKATREMETYLDQLIRMFPDYQQKNVRFGIKWENHDFGKYGEVVVYYDSDDEISRDYAVYIEHNLPARWDEESVKELMIES